MLKSILITLSLVSSAAFAESIFFTEESAFEADARSRVTCTAADAAGNTFEAQGRLQVVTAARALARCRRAGGQNCVIKQCVQN